ncbi:hypothetical protein BN1058_02232 [Paraliobacillus sp. PM-2]|uniref:DUF1659 domain-containing protein n=1 Tax=Paraliobacillus sp. PM-2 TaxID=1462524 RepID=UPI00061C9387|nr:DUF1659 domain-containing protein [Paraliobacillus sp. PM-2]CQR47899.1 hypothetical protein BN1058_02232 [Paraliobacillus sp. PM-2]
MVTAETLDTRLQLVFDNGLDEESGEIITKTKSFNNVKTDATADQLLAIAKALIPLQTLPLLMVKRNDTELITEA